MVLDERLLVNDQKLFQMLLESKYGVVVPQNGALPPAYFLSEID
jgi:hypothetical protein